MSLTAGSTEGYKVERNCTKCGKPARFVAADDLGLEWFECGDHGPRDNVAEVDRISLTAIDQWFKERGLDD